MHWQSGRQREVQQGQTDPWVSLGSSPCFCGLWRKGGMFCQQRKGFVRAVRMEGRKEESNDLRRKMLWQKFGLKNTRY